MSTTSMSAGSGEAVVLAPPPTPDGVAVAVMGHASANATAGHRPGRAVHALLPLGAAVVAALACAALLGTPLEVAAPVLLAWLLSLPGVREGLHRVDRGDLDVVGRRCVATFAATALTLVLLRLPARLVTDSALVLAVASVVLGLVVLVLGRVAPARVLVLGEPRAVGALVGRWPERSGAQVVGALLLGPVDDRDAAHQSLGTLPRAWDLSAVADLVAEWRIDSVAVVPTPSFGPAAVGRLAWQLEQARARLVVCTPELDAVARRRLALGRLSDTTFVRVASTRVPPLVGHCKAALDRFLATIALALVSPVLVVLGLLIRLDSHGPALFRQTRLGRDGEPFTMFKLRTMVVDAEQVRETLSEADEGNGVLFKMRRDPRVTRVGRILRRLSLDELPQLVNVVRGEMSLVGPRPALPSEAAQYDDLARRRLVVRPGITGLWQVRGRSDLDWESSVALDAQYADNVALVEDLLICLATVRAVVSRRGAY